MAFQWWGIMISLDLRPCNDFVVEARLYYRPQRSWGKVIFSQASVILSTGGLSAPRGVWSRRSLLPGEVPGPGGLLLGGWLPGPGRCLVRGCLVETPPRTATAVRDTHPTGMHSCFYNFEIHTHMQFMVKLSTPPQKY